MSAWPFVLGAYAAGGMGTLGAEVPGPDSDSTAEGSQ